MPRATKIDYKYWISRAFEYYECPLPVTRITEYINANAEANLVQRIDIYNWLTTRQGGEPVFAVASISQRGGAARPGQHLWYWADKIENPIVKLRVTSKETGRIQIEHSKPVEEAVLTVLRKLSKSDKLMDHEFRRVVGALLEE